ncbi:MAG: hypothetical protein KDE35_15645 [Geminicoccaceae bacterium]|nr:hypothetical protein [Geminicoccaceae bacterium]
MSRLRQRLAAIEGRIVPAPRRRVRDILESWSLIELEDYRALQRRRCTDAGGLDGDELARLKSYAERERLEAS